MNAEQFIKIFYAFLKEKEDEIKDKNENDITEKFVEWIESKGYECTYQIRLDDFLIEDYMHSDYKDFNLKIIADQIASKYLIKDGHQNDDINLSRHIINQLSKCLGNGKFHQDIENINDIWVYPKNLSTNNNIKKIKPQFLICEAKKQYEKEKKNLILDDYAIISACKIASYILFDCNDIVNTASIIYFSNSKQIGELVLDLKNFPEINISVCDLEENVIKNKMLFYDFLQSDFVKTHQIVFTKIKPFESVSKISNDKKISPDFIEWFNDLVLYIRTLLSMNPKSVVDKERLNYIFKKLEKSWEKLTTSENHDLDEDIVMEP